MQLANIRVLYIEDNRANLHLLESFFQKRHKILLYPAMDATTGIKLAKEKLPDLILMDIKLPDFSGFEALARLKAMPETADIPVIAVSANAHQNDIAIGLKAGFYHYLTKPLNLFELETVMAKAVGKEEDAQSSTARAIS